MKYSIVLMILCVFSIAGFSQNDKPRTNTTAARTEASQVIPSPINTYITTNFPDNKMIRNSESKDDMRNSYQVYLDNGTNLQFNSKNEVTMIQSKSGIPDAAIPEKIRKYVSSSFSANKISSWSWTDNNIQQVILDNGQKLEFNKDGDYIMTDK